MSITHEFDECFFIVSGPNDLVLKCYLSINEDLFYLIFLLTVLVTKICKIYVLFEFFLINAVSISNLLVKNRRLISFNYYI